MMAFSAENYATGEFLSDQRYVRWVYAVADNEGSGTTHTFYPMLKCNDDEFAKFKTPTDNYTATKV